MSKNLCIQVLRDLSDHLQEALRDLNTAFKAQPRLFIGPSNNQTNNMLAQAAAVAGGNDDDKYLSSVKTDSAALLSEWRVSKRVSNRVKEAEAKVLKPTLSKITLTSLKFSEALPFAASSSLLVEVVAKLEIFIEEVEELGKKVNFKAYKRGDDQIMYCGQNEAQLSNISEMYLSTPA